MKDTFVLYSNYYEILKDTTDTDLGLIFRAILHYNKFGECLKLPSHLMLAFGFIKNQLDLDEKKYSEKVERLKLNGKKGGLAKGSLANAKSSEEDLANLAIAKIAKHNENENENENENVLSLNNGEKEKIEKEEREILENYVRRKKLATKSVKAYVNRLVENGDYKEILDSERKLKDNSMSASQKIQEQLNSVHDKRSAAKVLVQYYAKGDFPPFEFDEIADKYDLDSYDKIYEYAEELSKTG